MLQEAERLHPLLTLPDRIYVINLPSRADRRQEIDGQLARVGLRLGRAPVELFSAIRPADAGGFPSIGARGCFLSHLGVLTDALARGYGCILILEDDADFSSAFLAAERSEMRMLAAVDWGMLYLGYRLPKVSGIPEGTFQPVPGEMEIVTAHAMLLRRAVIERLVPYLEAILRRQPGDPAGGPMHVDGAYSHFRRDNPDVRTLVPGRQWAVQRSSRTDIAQPGWRERIPFVTTLRRWKNRLAGV